MTQAARGAPHARGDDLISAIAECDVIPAFAPAYERLVAAIAGGTTGKRARRVD